MKYNRFFIPIFLSLVLLAGVAQPIASAIKTSENISNKVFRLHILANSDTTEDQNIKLMLKNYILENTQELLGGKTLEETVKTARKNTRKIAELCNSYLASIGCNQKVNVSVVKEYFKTRVYDDFTLPAGKYDSLKIEIGEGKGHNWWCIIFPSVCLSACTKSIGEYLTEEEAELVSGGYTPKFKAVEIYEQLKSRLES